MFRSLTRIARAIENLSETNAALLGAVHALATAAPEGSDVEPRVAALERELERRHAEAEGLLLKAQGKHDAARAAEERARRLSESAQEEREPIEVLAEQFEVEGLRYGDEEGSGANGVHPVPSGVAVRNPGTAAAFAMKFGGGR